jgi:catalase
LTTLLGHPVGDKTNLLTVGLHGPALLNDLQFIEEIAHFDRERIPERVVHAHGSGAFGYFRVTNPEIQKYCKAALFNSVGKETPVAVRFSTVMGEQGSEDTVFGEPRGFATKFYTEEGNWDIVANNVPMFFIRDPQQFSSLVHSQKRNPQSGLRDMDAYWDFISLRPETLNLVTFVYSDFGIPNGWRHMPGFSIHAFKLVNSENKAVFAKFHWITNQGIDNLDIETAAKLRGQ